MLLRRTFIATGAAALAMPSLSLAKAFEVPEIFKPQRVRVDRNLSVGQIIIESDEHFLYLITDRGEAMRYGVATGKPGLAFKGRAVIERKVKWPFWKPTKAMIKRNPRAYAKYADGMKGGPNNPLGARALYFYRNGRDTAIRIHGTTAPHTIGSASSNGCFRMVNAHVKDLYDRVPLGTVVTVT